MLVKSSGVTNTEKMLAELCENSFLKLWSYPNPFKEDGQELCDLLAVFENHVFIFFDRARQLEFADKDPVVHWNRWKRKVIDDQVGTAHGAANYVKSGRKIFLDNKLLKDFPLKIDREKIVIHKIIVAHGAREACESFSSDNVYGSLAVTYGDDDIGLGVPFIVHIDKHNPVHVFDSHNLPIIFNELDTFYDFSNYLAAKIQAIETLDILSYSGEEDLLAHYFSQFDQVGKKHFIGVNEEGVNYVMIGEGEWKNFIEHDVYKRKKKADEVSYFWDDLIQKTSQHVMDGTIGGDASFADGKMAIHEMAKEPRFMRRALSEKMIESIQNFPEYRGGVMRNLNLMPSFYLDKAYVFLQLKVEDITNYDEYRKKRQEMLEIACAAVKNKFNNFHTIVGIAIDAPKYSEMNSEDFILMNCRDWPENVRRHYEDLNKELKCFNTSEIKRYDSTIKEFP